MITIPDIILTDTRDKGHATPTVLAAKVFYCQLRRDGDKDPQASAYARQYGVTPATIKRWVKVIEDYGWGLDGKPNDLFGEPEKIPELLRGRPRKEEVKVPAWANEETAEAMKEFYQHRKKIKAPISTSQSAVRLCNRLTELSGADNAKAVKILQRSIDSGKWKDIYPLTEQPAESLATSW
jgi:hypothetical protein